MSPQAAPRSRAALCSGPERGGGGVRGRDGGGRPWAGAAAAVPREAGWDGAARPFPPPPPWPLSQGRRLCRALRCRRPPQPLSGVTARRWSRSGCERRSSGHYCAAFSAGVLVAVFGGSQVPLLPPWRRCQASTRGPSGLRIQGQPWFGGYPVPCVPCGGLCPGLGLDRSRGVQTLHFIFFRSVWLLSSFSPPPAQCLGLA